GGAERVIAVLSSQFAEKGYRVDLILSKSSGVYLETLSPLVNVIDLGCSKVSFSIIKLVRYSLARKPQVLFASQMHTSIASVLAARLAGGKTGVFIRQPTMLNPKNRVTNRRSWMLQKVFLTCAKGAEKVVLSSQAMASEFKAASQMSDDKLSVIHNPVQVSLVRQKSREPIDHSWFNESEAPFIISVGRLARVKGFETLLRAFAIVRQERAAKLLILGEGPLRHRLEELALELEVQDDVYLPGFVANPHK